MRYRIKRYPDTHLAKALIHHQMQSPLFEPQLDDINSSLNIASNRDCLCVRKKSLPVQLRRYVILVDIRKSVWKTADDGEMFMFYYP